MFDLKRQLIKVGSDNPNLRKYLRPILNYVTSKISRSHSGIQPGDKVQIGREVAEVKDIDEFEMYPVEVEFDGGFTGRYDFDDVEPLR
jgi:hypothetical protein